MAYEYQEFPKYKYHREQDPVVVHNAEQEAALGREWFDTPDFKNFKEEVVPVVEKVEVPEFPRSRRSKYEPQSDEN